MAKQQQVNDDADEFYTHSDPQSIKYRVIGASIIVLSCSLAWWFFLDHESKRYQSIEPVVKELVKVERFEIPPEVIQKQQAYKKRQEIKKSGTDKNVTAPVRTSLVSTTNIEPLSSKTTKSSDNKSAKQSSDKPASRKKNNVVQKAVTKKPEVTLSDAWVLQVGSFTDKANAEALRKKLYKSDISAYVKRFNINGRVIHRVIVGPKLDRHAVEKLQSRVRKKSGIQPLIVKFKTGFEE